VSEKLPAGALTVAVWAWAAAATRRSGSRDFMAGVMLPSDKSLQEILVRFYVSTIYCHQIATRL
jgi:hypothetical protein